MQPIGSFGRIQITIKDFPNQGYTITIENLLTHTSGIVDYEVLDFPVPNAIRVDFPAKQIIDSLGKLPLDFIPGSKYNYSNSNYCTQRDLMIKIKLFHLNALLYHIDLDYPQH